MALPRLDHGLPTQQWFEDNPKVSAYIPKELHEALEDWMAEQHIKKVSQALTRILEVHLGFSNEQAIDRSQTNYATTEQLNELKEELQKLAQRLEQKSAPIQSVSSRPIVDQISLIEISPKKETANANTEANEWMTTREAHTQYGKDSPYEGFRKYKPEKLKKDFGLEGDLSRKEKGKGSSRWIRKI